MHYHTCKHCIAAGVHFGKVVQPDATARTPCNHAHPMQPRAPHATARTGESPASPLHGDGAEAQGTRGRIALQTVRCIPSCPSCGRTPSNARRCCRYTCAFFRVAFLHVAALAPAGPGPSRSTSSLACGGMTAGPIKWCAHPAHPRRSYCAATAHPEHAPAHHAPPARRPSRANRPAPVYPSGANRPAPICPPGAPFPAGVALDHNIYGKRRFYTRMLNPSIPQPPVKPLSEAPVKPQ